MHCVWSVRGCRYTVVALRVSRWMHGGSSFPALPFWVRLKFSIIKTLSKKKIHMECRWDSKERLGGAVSACYTKVSVAEDPTQAF